MLNRAFADILRQLRQRKGFSQERFAYEAGLHRTYVSQLERGLKSPSLDTLGKIAAVLDIRLSSLLRQVERQTAKRPSRRK